MNAQRPVAGVWLVSGRTLTYLLDDRVEVGRVNIVVIEELDRMSYRDVRSVTTWRTAHRGRLVLAFLVAILVVVLAATVPAGSWMAVPAVLAVYVAWAVITGRPGVLLHVQLDDGLRSLRTVIGGGENLKDRVMQDLISRIELVR